MEQRVFSESIRCLYMIDQDGTLKELQSRMKEDWDERIRHDYRYWMSDGVKNDEEMWLTGQRDFEILTNGISDAYLSQARVLDLGCGVGRILKTAASVCLEAVGIDVSEEAISTARSFLSEYENAQLVLGQGAGIDQVENEEIDLAISFAALCSMPAIVVAAYMHELSRVLRMGGLIRLQIYLGKEQEISEEDTLALRSYEEERFFTALEHAGFEINYKQEVILPFEVSDYENGIIAYVIGARKISNPLSTVEEIYEILVNSKEHKAGTNWSGSKTAYLVALARAKQQLESRELDKAEESIRLAISKYHGSAEEAEVLILELNELKNEEQKISTTNIDRKEKLKVLTEEKPLPVSDFSKNNLFSITETNDGKVLHYEGICLSHLQSPKKAGFNWAKRALKSLSKVNADIVMAGLGDGHFAEALAELSGKIITVYETNQELLSTNTWYDRDKIKLITSLKSLDKAIQDGSIGMTPELVILPSGPFYMDREIEEVKRKITSRHLVSSLSPQIAIVGPLYGGSLPIAEYVYRACEKLGMKSSYLNLSSYYNTFTSFEKTLKKQESRSVLENQCVEMLSELVLQVVLERKIDILISVAQAPLTPKVLEKCREKGIVTVHWFMEDINRFPTWKQIAKYYDYFFVIQKDEAIERIREVGGRRVHYLPLACDPDIHTSMTLSPEEMQEFGSDISFVGAGYNNRKYVFSKFAKDDFKIWGTEWPDILPFAQMVQRKGSRISVQDYIRIFNSSVINLNLHSSHEKNGIDPTGDFVNPRTFELAACQAFQLVDRRTLLGELFADDEIATFETESELKDKINYFLSAPEEREKYIKKSYERVCKDHTYEQRVQTMLEYVYADYAPQLAQRSNNDLWSRTLLAASPYQDLQHVLKAAQERGEEPTIEALTQPLVNSAGKLSDVEKKLMFMHHMRGQISQINQLRNKE